MKKGGGGHGAKKNFSFVSFFVDPKSNFLKKNQNQGGPLKVWIYIFKTGFSFPVALIQNEKIKVERVSILMGHPVYLKNNDANQNE